MLWLGELRHYADVDGGAAILSRLDGLLEEDGYVVITTIWPGYWDSYAAAAAAGLGAADPAAVAGQLLARLDESYEYLPDVYNPALGGVVDVPDRFTPGESRRRRRDRRSGAGGRGRRRQPGRAGHTVPGRRPRLAGPL